MNKDRLPLPNLNLRGRLCQNELMSKHTSWRVGGVADNVYFPADVTDLGNFIKELGPNYPIFFTGLGSNILIRDKGLRGAVVITNPALNELALDRHSNKELIYAGAGVPSPKLAKFSANHGMEGLEFLAGVPGTVGGALAMNAGCYGKETWGVTLKVRMVDRYGKYPVRFPHEFDIGYRSVTSKIAKDEFFIGAWFESKVGCKTRAKNNIKNMLKKRKDSQPTQKPSAGSVFRNPTGDYAARLIEQCGLKGFNIGGASISNKHANFFINTGDATARDFELLIQHVKEKVLSFSGVALEQEVIIVGEE